MNEKTNGSIKKSLNEILEDVFAWVVVGAIVAEAYFGFVFTRGETLTERSLIAGANLVVGLGVLGEFLFGGNARAEAKTREREADARAEDAKLESLRLAREIEKLKQPRTLEQQGLLARLKDIPTARLRVGYVKECTDCEWLASLLASTFQRAGWTLLDFFEVQPGHVPAELFEMLPITTAPYAAPWGVTVLARTVDSSSTLSLWSRVLRALSEDWPESNGELAGKQDPSLPEDVIRIVVAPRA